MSDFAEPSEEPPADDAPHREGALLEEEACFRDLFSQEIQSTIQDQLLWLEQADSDSYRFLMSFVVRLSLSEAKAKYVDDPVRDFCRSQALRLKLPEEAVKYKLKAGLLLLGDKIKKGAR